MTLLIETFLLRLGAWVDSTAQTIYWKVHQRITKQHQQQQQQQPYIPDDDLVQQAARFLGFGHYVVFALLLHYCILFEPMLLAIHTTLNASNVPDSVKQGAQILFDRLKTLIIQDRDEQIISIDSVHVMSFDQPIRTLLCFDNVFIKCFLFMATPKSE